MSRLFKYFVFAVALLCGLASAQGTEPFYRTSVGQHICGRVPAGLLRDSLPALTLRAERVLRAAYMADSLIATSTSVPGWEGYPVKLYSYYTGTDVACGKRKHGLVYLLNPSPEKLATWVATTVWALKGNLNYRSTSRLLRQVLIQSGGQFPVQGVVFEDMEGDGTYWPYIFADGVTAYIADPAMVSTVQPPTQAMLEHYITASYAQLKGYSGTYARVCGTTPEQYTAFGGDTLAESPERAGRPLTSQWLPIVRRLYQLAWNSDFNELFLMWGAENL